MNNFLVRLLELAYRCIILLCLRSSTTSTTSGPAEPVAVLYTNNSSLVISIIVMC